MIDRLLQSQLQPIAHGVERWRLHARLAAGWLAATLIGLVLIFFQRRAGWVSAIGFPFLIAAAVFFAVRTIRRARKTAPDLRALAREIERENPELHAILLTAVEQEPDPATGELGYLQQRVVEEALVHYRQSPWGQHVARRLFAARCGQGAALISFLLVLTAIAPKFPSGGSLWADAGLSHGITVTPGDTALERGSGLVVLARFEGRLPTEATLVIRPVNENERRIPLAKNLHDPVFGGGIPAVKGDATYRIESTAGNTRDFKVTVFDFPRLERADAKITYPAYTGLPEKTIKDTRRVSAVEGSSLAYSFFLNKPVTSARLVARDKSVVPLTKDAENASTYHLQAALDQSRRYELQLVDDAGRTNKMPPEFVLEATRNRPAELKLTSPRGDQRVSPLEEISFQAEASDDFGLRSYGIAYTLAGADTRLVELGTRSGPNEKRQLKHVLPLESLGAQPDQLLSYYLWADDTGPDGNPRRTTSDIYFAEIKPFDEIFREGSEADNSSSPVSGGQQPQTRSEKLGELQKQIITATWNLKRRETAAKPAEKYREDAGVVRDSQQQAVEQARALEEAADDPRVKGFIQAARRAMEKAAGELGEAADKNTVPPLTPALAAEQSAYQALLKLQAREVQVTRGQGSQSGGRQGGQRSQRQIDELDLRQTANRYENQREAAAQQTPEQREQLQVVNRLKELAQRQQDVNERLKELQTALQEARTAQEKQAIRDRLKRLREEQQDLLADVDELRQRLDRPENQSRMAEARQQLDQTRSDVQQASEALDQQSVPQALASGTRAQRELQQLHDEVRKNSSAQFANEMREMRDAARQLAEKEEDIRKNLEQMSGPEQKTLSDSAPREALANRITEQKNALTNLFTEMRQVSEQSETTQPLLSQQLYDTLRQAPQDELNKSLDLSAELVQRGFVPQAGQFEQRARENIDELKRAVERAAESVLGDDTEALRLARKELEELSRQLDQEVAQAGQGRGTNAAGAGVLSTNLSLDQFVRTLSPADAETFRQMIERRGASANPEQPLEDFLKSASPQEARGLREMMQRAQGESQAQPGRQAKAGGSQGQNQPGEEAQPGQPPGGGKDSGDQGQQQQASAQGQGQSQGQSQAQGQGQGGRQPGSGSGRGSEGETAQADSQDAPDDANGGSRGGGRRNAGANRAGDNYGGGYGGGAQGPLLGADYVDWTDRLRNVEEMIEVPDLRTEVARVRDAARAIRLDYKRLGKKPDWAVVKQRITNPLAEVRARVDEELARRASKDALVPLDRDPVPAKFSELVRKYYEQLGKTD